MIGVMDSWWVFLRDFVGANPSLIGIPLALFLVAGIVLKRVKPESAATFDEWVRMSRYCHDCPHVDLLTRECAISAKYEDKCGLIDKTAGMSFTVTKD